MKEKGKTNFGENFKLFYKIIRPDRNWAFLLLIIAFVMEVLMIADNLLIKWLIDYGNDYVSGVYLGEEIIRIFSIILLVFFGIVIFRSALRFAQMHIRNRLMARVDYNIKKKYFGKVLDFDYDFHVKNKSGSLISQLDRGARSCVSLTELVTQRLFSPIFSLIVVLFSIAYFDIVPALISVGVAVVILVFSLKIFKDQANVKLVQNESLDEEKGFVSNILSSFEAVKFFGKEKNIKGKYSKLISDSQEKFIKFNDYYRLYSFLMSITLGIGTILLLYFSLKSFVSGRIEIGTVVFIFTTFGRMINPIVNLTDSLRAFNESMSDIQALFEHDKIIDEIKDSPDAKNLRVGKGEIEFRDVSFDYGKKSKTKIFGGLNFKIKGGESVAIIGASGTGKTSLLRLLFRLYDPRKGDILIDGKNLKNVTQKSLRENMSIVPQEPVLFHDSIYNNVKFSKPSAGRKDVVKALKMSSAYAFVNKFSDKWNTLVGERGVRLSGGEKQRVAIARALLANKKIIVLDEPTSSLDLETENKIQMGIRNLLKGRTSIIIAHRLSTIKDVDRIIVLKKGRVFEEGTHRELLRKRGEYWRLWEIGKKK
jgi:ABC-type multidrug transport system fused ATPase/permease subunit